MSAKSTPAPAEIAVRLGAWPGFVLPPLNDVAAWIVPGPASEQVHDTVHYDTADLRLIRFGASLRRSLDGDGRPCWVLSLPDLGGGAPAERSVPVAAVDPGSGPGADPASGAPAPGDPDSEPPAELTALVRAVTRAAAIQPVAHLRTKATVVPLCDPADRPLGEVRDDEVSVLEGDYVAARFRQLEVLLGAGAPARLLDVVAERLRTAGAGDPDPAPNLARALGPRAYARSELVAAPVGRGASATDAMRATITGALGHLVRHDLRWRLGEHVVGVHQMRVSARRMRSLLSLAPEVIGADAATAHAVVGELRWLASTLGAARDVDVLRGLLADVVPELDEQDRPAAEAVVARLDVEHTVAQSAVAEAIGSDRYVALLDALVAIVTDAADLGEPAEEPRSLIALASRPWRKLTAVVGDRDLGEADDEVLHQVRIKAKRARYAAELAAVAVPAAGAHASAIAGVQGTLGDQHDAVVAAGWLRNQVGALTAAEAFAAGLLVAAVTRRGEEAREAAAEAWQAARRKKVRRWLDG